MESMGLRENAGLTSYRISEHENLPLNAYCIVDERLAPLVLLNAMGMPVALVAPFMRWLSSYFSVYTWETRGLPSLAGNSDQILFDVEQQVSDFERVADYFDIRSAPLVGWCSGAQIALRCAQTMPQRIERLLLLSGAYTTRQSELESAYEVSLYSMLRRIAIGRSAAQMAFKLAQSAVSNAERTGLEGEIASMIGGATDALLEKHSRLPYESVENLYCYARMIAALRRDKLADEIASIEHPALLLHGEKDTTTLPAVSEWVSSRLKNASFSVLKDVNHFSAYYITPEFAGKTLAFLMDKSANHMRLV